MDFPWITQYLAISASTSRSSTAGRKEAPGIGVAFDDLSVVGEQRVEVATGEISVVSDVAEFAGAVGENDATD